MAKTAKSTITRKNQRCSSWKKRFGKYSSAKSPKSVSKKQILFDMKRRSAKTISHAIGLLYNKAWIENPTDDEYKLTSLGYEKAVEVISKLLNKKT